MFHPLNHFFFSLLDVLTGLQLSCTEDSTSERNSLGEVSPVQSREAGSAPCFLFLAFLTRYHTPGDGEFLCPKEGFLKNLPPLLNSLVFPDFQRALLTNSLKNWMFAFLKLNFLILLFTCVILLRSLNSTITWQPPLLMSLVSSLALVSNRSSIASPLLDLAVFFLAQEVILNTFPKPRELSTAHYTTFPEDVRVAEVPQEDESLLSQHL